MKRFNKTVLKIDKGNDHVIMTTFQARLVNPNLIFSLGKTTPTSMIDLLFKAWKYEYGKDALAAKSLTSKRKEDKRVDLQKRNKDCKFNPSNNQVGTASLETIKKRLSFTPLLMPIDKILMQIKEDPTQP